MTRNKKQVNVSMDLVVEANQILSNFEAFTGGWRVLFLIHRNKEGGETNNTKVRKVITKNDNEFAEALIELLAEKNSSSIPLRIYSSVNRRDFDKAIRKFKFEQLESDYYDVDHRNGFYLDLKNRFIGCLMSPGTASESKFIVDVDSIEELDIAHKAIAEANLNDHVVMQYKTKNGWHIVMAPFNPQMLGEMSSKINKDGLLLLSY